MEQAAFNFDAKDDLYDRLFADVSKDLLAAFKEYHRHNPHVYELFKRFALEAKASGRKRFSHWAILSRVRWNTAIETRGEDFKINNDYAAVMVRMLIFNHPEFEDFFSLRKCKPDRFVPGGATGVEAYQ